MLSTAFAQTSRAIPTSTRKSQLHGLKCWGEEGHLLVRKAEWDTKAGPMVSVPLLWCCISPARCALGAGNKLDPSLHLQLIFQVNMTCVQGPVLRVQFILLHSNKAIVFL